MYPFYLFKLDFYIFENNCFICIVKIKSKSKLLKITDPYSMYKLKVKICLYCEKYT